MKKIFTLIAAIALTTTAANAQRIYDITFDGVTPLSKCGYKNPSGTTTPGLLEVVFPEGTDLSNIKATPVPSDAITTITTTPLPTNFTNSVLFDVKKEDATATPVVPLTTASYNVVFRTIKAASLPLNVDFSSTNLPVWNSSIVGWAATCVNETKSAMSFENTNRGLILAFKDAPATLSYKILSSGTWGTGVFDVEESSNGMVWTSVCQYTATIGAESSKSHDLKGTTRFVRFNYTFRNGANVSVNNFAVTKGTGTAISTEEASAVNAFMAQGTKNLTITNAAEVSKLEVVNMVGQTVLSVAKPENNIALGQLSNGVYLVKFALNNGKIATAKIIVK